MRIFITLLLLFATPVFAGDAPKSSPWREFSEARVRLLLVPGGTAGEPLRGALEIRLAPGYKTYWRNPGDSGAPPSFDFAGSKGIGPVDVNFPFPERFDDGAGGQAIGYKRDVLLPFEITRSVGNTPLVLNLALDFAVCGTMCIPLKASLSLDPATAASAPEMRAALESVHDLAPRKLSSDAAAKAVQVRRLASSTRPLFLVSLSGKDLPEDTTGFIDATGLFDLLNRSPSSEGFDLLFEAHPAPGSQGRFGQARLTYGDKTKAFDVIIDLDGAPFAP